MRCAGYSALTSMADTAAIKRGRKGGEPSRRSGRLTSPLNSRTLGGRSNKGAHRGTFRGSTPCVGGGADGHGNRPGS